MTKRDMMPMNPILIIKIFDIWRIDFIESFPKSFENEYILVTLDYVSKLVKVIPCKSNDSKIVIKFLKEHILSHFGIPRAIISDHGTYFYNRSFASLMKKYNINDKMATPYHLQISGQVQVFNH